MQFNVWTIKQRFYKQRYMYPIKIIKHAALWTLIYFSSGHKWFKSNKTEIYALFLFPQGIFKLLFLPDFKSSVWGWKGNVWSLPRKKSSRVILVFFFWRNCLVRRNNKSISFLQYRLQKILKGYLKPFFTTSTCILHHRHPKLHQAMPSLDLRRSTAKFLHCCPAASTVSFLCET